MYNPCMLHVFDFTPDVSGYRHQCLTLLQMYQGKDTSV